MKTVSLKLPLATSPARRSQPCYADRTTVTMLREKTAMPPATIPECVLVDFHESEGTVPPGRWGHSAAVINDRLYVFGGEGDQAFGDLNVYAPGDSAGPSHSRGRVKFTINLLAWFQQNLPGFAENKQWHTLKVCTLEGPSPMYGHAACSTGSQMFIYGGRQGRKVLHGLYKLCTGAC